nr:hypothetical protein [Tanacetum cinerariifolium]
MSHVSGLGDGVDIQSKVHDEQQQKVTGTNEGTGVRPEVPDVPKYALESDEESWTFNDDEVSYDHGVYTPPDHQLTNEEENQEGDDVVKEGEKEQEKEEEPYGDLNINLHRSDTEMTDAQ